MIRRAKYAWVRFWMLFAGRRHVGRIATRLVTWQAGPYHERIPLARLNAKGYIAPSATIHHSSLRLGTHVLINDGVMIFEDQGGGAIEIADDVHLHNNIYIQTGHGGSVTIASGTRIQPRCQLSAYKSSIRIGGRCEIAPNCAFYPYNHGIQPGDTIRSQALQTKGDIVLEDDVWLGYGVIVLDGVRIGSGAVVGAGAVVTKDIPAGAVAVGNPARVVKFRADLNSRVRNRNNFHSSHSNG